MSASSFEGMRMNASVAASAESTSGRDIGSKEDDRRIVIGEMADFLERGEATSKITGLLAHSIPSQPPFEGIWQR